MSVATTHSRERGSSPTKTRSTPGNAAVPVSVATTQSRERCSSRVGGNDTQQGAWQLPDQDTVNPRERGSSRVGSNDTEQGAWQLPDQDMVDPRERGSSQDRTRLVEGSVAAPGHDTAIEKSMAAQEDGRGPRQTTVGCPSTLERWKPGGNPGLMTPAGAKKHQDCRSGQSGKRN